MIDTKVRNEAAWRSLQAIVLICAACGVWGTGCSRPPMPTVGPADAEAGRLIAFVDAANTAPLAVAFREDALGAIQEVANELGVRETVWDIRVGAPAEVTFTPMLVYMNHRGRSIYQGRYTTPDRLRTFLRIAQRHPQTPETLALDNAAVWRDGRAETAMILKVAPLQGTKPEGYEENAFRENAARDVFAGLKKFKHEEPVRIERAQRRFYFDINPWAGADGTLFLSVAVFSQFHCEEPIIFDKEHKITGPWEKRAELFARAAQEFEDDLADVLKNAVIGDGFQAVARDVRTLTWDEMGLALPEPPASRSKDLAGVELPRRWKVLPRAAGDRPSVIFQFASPLDAYVGEVQEMRGTVVFGVENAIANMQANFATNNATISMGMADFTDIVKESMFLGVAKFPQSSFVLETFEADAAALGTKPVSGSMHGNFTLKDKSIPLVAEATIEPFLAANGEPRLDLAARFTLHIDAFDLPAPDGPTPQKHTMLIDVDATLVADESNALSDIVEPKRAIADAKAEGEVASSLLGKPLLPLEPGAAQVAHAAKLADARAAHEANSDDVDAYIWVGRRLGYLWQMQDAIDWYSRGLEKWPDDPRLLRHRGHRYLSLRKFDAALADFERAAALVDGKPDEIEQDGLPNAQNIPLTTLGFNIWYHIGVAKFCKGDFDGAVAAFEKTQEFINDHDDNRVAVSDWLYMALRRLDRDDEAKALLAEITRDMEIIENDSYHQRLLMYKGEIPPASLLDTDNATDLELATQGFGVGHWHLLEGREAEANQVFEKVVAGKSWPAFGFIAAEAELARQK